MKHPTYPSTIYGHPTYSRQLNTIYRTRSISPRRTPKLISNPRLRNPHHAYRRCQRQAKYLKSVERLCDYYVDLLREYLPTAPNQSLTTLPYTYENQEAAIKDFWVRNLPSNNSENTPINPTQTPQDRA